MSAIVRIFVFYLTVDVVAAVVAGNAAAAAFLSFSAADDNVFHVAVQDLCYYLDVVMKFRHNGLNVSDNYVERD